MGWLFFENYTERSLYPITIGTDFRNPYMREICWNECGNTRSLEIGKVHCIVHDTFQLALYFFEMLKSSILNVLLGSRIYCLWFRVPKYTKPI